MEDLAVFRAERTHIMSASVSSSSLEIGQILGTDTPRSLLSESVTCASLSSEASEILQAAPPRTLPTFTTVALGEHLKMFPAFISGSERKSGRCVVLAAPTSPRLRSMCRECLSITKWAEYSTTFQAPEHIPWEGILKNGSRKWVPEGSIFSPEGFSYILSQVRKGGLLHDLGDDPDIQGEDYVATIPSPSTIDSEVLGMMRELQSLRSCFAATLKDDHFIVDRPPVPALVVSTSHVTFPLALESFQNLSQQPPSMIASRRGKEAPSLLTIPTSDFGLPCPASQVEEQEGPSEAAEKTLRVEEMINNLRLQCSTMSLQSPSIDDPSWNSRSAIPTYSDKKRTDGTLAKIRMNDYAKVSVCPKIQTPRPPTGRHNSGLPAPRYERQYKSPRAAPTMRASGRIGIISSPLQISGKPMPATKMAERVVLRSAMKERGVHRENALKNVRFALPQSEVHEDPTRQSPFSRLPPTNEVETAGRSVTLPVISAARIMSCRTTPPTVVADTKARVVPSSLLKGRAQSLSISSPFRKIALSRGSVELKTSESGTPAIGLRRSHTLGRRALSRVIKVPLFTSKELTKRTTISADSTTLQKYNNNVAGREVSMKKRRITDVFNRFK